MSKAVVVFAFENPENRDIVKDFENLIDHAKKSFEHLPAVEVFGAINDAAAGILDIVKTDGVETSNLVDHAKRELELIGENPDTIEGYLRVIRAFSSCGHSGGSASVAIPTINQLLQYKPLTDLTNDPEEWIHHTKEVWGEPGGIWQNVRNGEAFSTDGGKTYYLLSERADAGPEVTPIHTSKEKN